MTKNRVLATVWGAMITLVCLFGIHVFFEGVPFSEQETVTCTNALPEVTVVVFLDRWQERVMDELEDLAGCYEVVSTVRSPAGYLKNMIQVDLKRVFTPKP